MHINPGSPRQDLKLPILLKEYRNKPAEELLINR